MNDIEFINKLKDKYDIQTETKTKLITLSEHEYNVQKISDSISQFDFESIKRICQEIYDENGNLIWHLIEYLDLEQYIMTIRHTADKGCQIEFGYVFEVDAENNIILRSTMQSTVDKVIPIEGTIILTRYTDAQLNILRLQRMLNQCYK